MKIVTSDSYNLDRSYFDDLLLKWSSIGFLEFFCWDEITNENGIDLENEKLSFLINFFRSC